MMNAYRLIRRILVLVLVLSTGLIVLARPAQEVRAQSNEADISVYLWPDDKLVETGELVFVEVQVKNDGDADAHDVFVRLPKHDRQYIYTDTKFDDTSDEDVTLNIGTVPANGGERFYNVYLRVRNDPPMGMFYLYATYEWDDSSGGERDVRSERIKMTIADVDYVVPDDDDIGEVVSFGQPASGPDMQPPRISDIRIAPFGRDGFELLWEGSDNSGVEHYDVEYKIVPGGGWTRWKEDMTDTRAVLAPTEGKDFTFRIRATDWAGNESRWVESPVDTRSFR